MSRLAIKRIEVFQVDLPYAGGTYTLSGGRQYRSFDATIVRITTDTGIEGWGESTPFGSTYVASHALGVRAGIAEIAPKLIGLDPRRVDRINDAMNEALVGHEHAKTALDVACWDIFGKSTGLPVCELLGGRTGVKMPIISSIPVQDPEAMRGNVARHRAKGYTSHSVKIGGDPVLDAQRVTAALADYQQGEYYIVDANGGLTGGDSLALPASPPERPRFCLRSAVPFVARKRFPSQKKQRSDYLRRACNERCINRAAHRGRRG